MFGRCRDRGPLARASSVQVAALRQLVVAYRDWERRLGTPEQTLVADVPASARTLQLSMFVETEIAERARRRGSRRVGEVPIREVETRLRARARQRSTEHLDVLHNIHREVARVRELLEDRAD